MWHRLAFRGLMRKMVVLSVLLYFLFLGLIFFAFYYLWKLR